MLLVIVGTSISVVRHCPRKCTEMYIEFDLTNGLDLQSTDHKELWQSIYAARYATIVKNLNEWSEQYEIPVHAKLLNKRLKVTLPDNAYEFWAMTWDPKTNSSKYYRLVEPMNID